MVKSSSESSGMGYEPFVVAEPYGGFWSSPPTRLLYHSCLDMRSKHTTNLGIIDCMHHKARCQFN